MSRSKYDQDNPYHGYGGSRPSAYASWEQPAYSSTPRNSSTTTRNTGASTAKRYTAGTTAQATPSWSSHPREGFAQQAASGNGRTYTRGPAYDAHDDYTSTRKTRAGYSYETYTADFTTKTPKKPAEPYFSTTYPAPEPKESAYARTSQRQYSATPKATATTSGNSSSSSPRPKSTAGTQQQPPRPTTPNLNGGGFDLKAYIREKQAKEVREAEVKKAEDDAARRERHDKHDRERRRKAEELKKRHNEEQLHQEARSAEREATFGGSDGYGSGDRHRGNRKWSSYETPVDSEDDDDLEKLAEEALKAKTSRPKHTSGTARRRRSPLKTKADREARARKATAASPVPPTSEAWFGPEVQKSEFDFRPPAYKTDADGIRVYNVDPDSDSSVENQSDYYSDKNRTTDGSGTKSYPAPPIFGDATKAQAKRDNIPQPASHASKLTPPTSPQATTKKGSPDQQKPTATKQESPRSFLGFVYVSFVVNQNYADHTDIRKGSAMAKIRTTRGNSSKCLPRMRTCSHRSASKRSAILALSANNILLSKARKKHHRLTSSGQRASRLMLHPLVYPHLQHRQHQRHRICGKISNSRKSFLRNSCTRYSRLSISPAQIPARHLAGNPAYRNLTRLSRDRRLAIVRAIQTPSTNLIHSQRLNQTPTVPAVSAALPARSLRKKRRHNPVTGLSRWTLSLTAEYLNLWRRHPHLHNHGRTSDLV